MSARRIRQYVEDRGERTRSTYCPSDPTAIPFPPRHVTLRATMLVEFLVPTGEFTITTSWPRSSKYDTYTFDRQAVVSARNLTHSGLPSAIRLRRAIGLTSQFKRVTWSDRNVSIPGHRQDVYKDHDCYSDVSKHLPSVFGTKLCFG